MRERMMGDFRVIGGQGVPRTCTAVKKASLAKEWENER